MKKVSKNAKEVARHLTEAGFSAHVIVDADGEPTFASGWYKDLLISNIELKEKKE